ncbi:halocyanin domain-containing protein [Haloarcula amylovorans]|uniref:halocyanin domain-containing protein n=1 Tax=Haloarcula amylovorans TaxID=2562280 RepID=UPI00107679D7|nr:halocyanin domain-containing protein [Halomicroarcula amylolytica]
MTTLAVSRRQLLRTVAITGVGGVAGCGGGSGDGGDDSDGGTVSAEAYPSIDEWLTETDIGGADDTYDGALTDSRDSPSLTVDVGAEGNNGNFAYSPSAVVVSTGTEIRWNWTGEGNPHNVEALPEEQLGESDYEFSSGEAVGGSGVKYTRTVEETGVALYHCEPHFSLGMKGGIAVG